MARKIDPRQLTLFSTPAPAPAMPEFKSGETIFLEWLDEPAPLIHIFGFNPHIVEVTTLRSEEESAWLSRKWVMEKLRERGYRGTHTLTTTRGKAKVYRPLKWKK